MRMILRGLSALLLALLLAVPAVFASSVDTWITNLKDKDSEVRAKAAFELGCT